VFLTDRVVGPGYGHTARLLSVGACLQNRTLDRPSLRGLPYAGQRAEICGRRDKLHARFGVRSRLFRPPYGTYDTTTLRAAADCGVRAVVLWRASTQDTGLRFLNGPYALRPGDILLVTSDDAPEGPTLRERTARLLRRIQGEGLTVGRQAGWRTTSDGRTGRTAGADGARRNELQADAPQAIGTPLDRVLTTVIVSGLALPPGECQHSDGQVRHPRRRIDLVATSDS
jgi:hypothetical protein